MAYTHDDKVDSCLAFLAFLFLSILVNTNSPASVFGWKLWLGTYKILYFSVVGSQVIFCQRKQSWTILASLH